MNLLGSIYTKTLIALCALAYVNVGSIKDYDFSRENMLLTKTLQNDYSDNAINFFKFVTFFGESYCYFIILVLHLHFSNNKIYSFMYIFFISLIGFYVDLLKIAYASERPFQLFSEIKAIACELDFGLPSGHAWGSLVFYFILFDYWKPRGKKGGNSSVANNSENFEGYPKENIQEILDGDYREEKAKAFSIILLQILSLVAAFLIGWSRVVMGVHSFNQIAVGYSYGFLSLIIFFSFRKKLYIIFRRLVSLKEKNLQIKAFALALILHIFHITITLIPFFLRVDKQSNIEIIMRNIELAGCSKSSNLKYLTNKNFLSTATISISFGIVYGFIFLKGSFFPSLFDENYKKLKLYQKLLRLIVKIVIVALFGVAVLEIPGENVYVLYYLRNNLSFCLLGFSLVVLVPFSFRVLRCDIPGDLYFLGEEIYQAAASTHQGVPQENY